MAPNPTTTPALSLRAPTSVITANTRQASPAEAPRAGWTWLLAISICLALPCHPQAADTPATDDGIEFEKLGVMMKVLDMINRDYVGDAQVDLMELLNGEDDGLDGALDPYSRLLRPNQARRMSEASAGGFGGLGLVVGIRQGCLTVIAPLEGTPGARAGLRSGDRIVHIDGEPTQGLSLQEMIRRMKGRPGTKVKITSLRPATGESRTVKIERELIEMPTVRDARILDPDIGYLQITRFTGVTPKQLRAAVESLRERRAASLIIDLRDNPGGSLDAVVSACGLFLPGKRLVVRTVGRRKSRRYFTSRKRPKFTAIPIVLVVNYTTASAAEIMAGCLQDWRRGLVVGDRTFGKASVQSMVSLPDGSALRLTTATHFTPFGRCISEKGIQPDIDLHLKPEEVMALYDSLSEGPTHAGTSAPLRDPYLKQAVEVVRNYGTLMEQAKAAADTPEAIAD